ncbi:MAG: amino acid adenylation domain-containing protein, partial [Acidobacteriaceae bacterium]|nr:amino acid adenylation domain-containing protein [Acidobacteriaceae bacterium]
TSTLQSSLPSLRNTEIITLDVEWPSIVTESVENVASGATADTPAYVIYTSGSTGVPKGCIVTHYNVIRLFASTEHWFHFSARDVWTLFHSSAFDFSVWEIWGALLHGGRLVVVPYQTSRSFDLFYRLLAKQGVTVLNQTPSAFRQLIAAEERDGLRPDLSLRLVIFGGEALELQSLRPWFLRHGDHMPQLVNMYGITETTVHVTYRPLSIADLDRQGSVIGGPIPDLQLYILDRYLEPVPVGIPGELHVGGAGLARGYLNQPDLTATRFIPHPFGEGVHNRLYKTGDLARQLPDGDIEYLGRLDQQVKIRGFRVELGEIEAALARQSDVSHAAVITRKNRAGETQLVAYVVPAVGASLDFAEIRRNLRTFLPEYMIPGLFVELDALPLTRNGKIDHAALPDPSGARLDAADKAAPPRDALEELLAALWERILDVRGIGVHDNFFDAGGHSLAALRLSAEVEREFLIRLPVSALFQNPTIAGLAALLRSRPELPWLPAVPIQKGDGRQPLFFVPGGGGNMVYLTALAPLLGSQQALYGMQYRGLDGETPPDTSVEFIAGRMLEAIHGVQPSGPYRLGGHCFGGLIAFEMARQLCRRGEQVELLAILDIPAPLGPAVSSIDPGQAYWIETLAQAWEEATGKYLPVRRADLEAAGEESQLELLRRALVSADLLPSEAPLNSIRGMVNVFRANSMARYRCEDTIPAPIKLFRASEFHAQFDYSAAEDANSEAPSTLGWARLSTEPVAVH